MNLFIVVISQTMSRHFLHEWVCLVKMTKTEMNNGLHLHDSLQTVQYFSFLSVAVFKFTAARVCLFFVCLFVFWLKYLKSVMKEAEIYKINVKLSKVKSWEDRGVKNTAVKAHNSSSLEWKNRIKRSGLRRASFKKIKNWKKKNLIVYHLLLHAEPQVFFVTLQFEESRQTEEENFQTLCAAWSLQRTI